MRQSLGTTVCGSTTGNKSEGWEVFIGGAQFNNQTELTQRMARQGAEGTLKTTSNEEWRRECHKNKYSRCVANTH